MRIGEYELERPLGEGGFASVWSARHHVLRDRRVAAKILKDPDRRELLRSEAECLSGLDHPNIARAVGLDLDHDPPYLLVELHEGRTLRQVMQESLSPERTYALFRQLVDALAAAHARGVAHGDLKPENVLVDFADRLKLTDFGLGHQVATEASLMLSGNLESADATPGLAGTIPYMAPEQREGQPPDPTSDVFSLGIMLHEMLTGRRPQPGDDPREHLRNPPAWLRVWERCYSRRDRRLKDAGQVAAALDAALRNEPPEVHVRRRSDEREEHARPEPVRPEPVRPDPRVEEARRQRLVITNRELESGWWSLEQIEQVVAQEAGVRVSDLRSPLRPEGPMGRLVHWAEEHLIGEERELHQARAMVWFLAHEFLREPLEELAARYRVSPSVIDAGIRLVRRRRVPQTVWRGVVQRLASLPQPLVQEARGVDDTTLRAGVGAVALATAAVLMVPALALILAGNFPAGMALLALASASAYGGGRLVSPTAEQEQWIEDHLEQLPGADRRAKLAHLAVQTELRGLSRTARRLLAREPLQVVVRPKVRATERSRAEEEARSPERAAPTRERVEAALEPRPIERLARAREHVEPARERVEPAPGRAEPARERVEPALERAREQPAPVLDRAEPPRRREPPPVPERPERPRAEAATVEAAPPSAPPGPARRPSLDEMIRDRAARAREAEAPSPDPEDEAAARPDLDALIRQRAAAAREAAAREEPAREEPAREPAAHEAEDAPLPREADIEA
ncbi:MAG: protein kinase [Planctomycetota bacterium]